MTLFQTTQVEIHTKPLTAAKLTTEPLPFQVCFHIYKCLFLDMCNLIHTQGIRHIKLKQCHFNVSIFYGVFKEPEMGLFTPP